MADEPQRAGRRELVVMAREGGTSRWPERTAPAEDRTPGGGRHRNPPLVDDVAREDGGLGMSVGAAGRA